MSTIVAPKIVSCVLSSVLSAVAKAREHKRDAFDRIALDDPKLSDLVRRAVEVFATSGGAPQDLETFLLRPQTLGLIRDLFIDDVAGEKGSRDVIESIFCAYYRSAFTQSTEEIGRKLFSSLESICERTLQIASQRGYLAAHDGLETRRQKVLLAELNSLGKKLDAARGEQSEIVEHDRKFLTYRRQAVDRFGSIALHHIEAQRRVQIDRLFVPPKFLCAEPEAQHPLAFSDFYESLYRSVVVGNPGGGKTTLATKICSLIASASDETGARPRAPVMVVLRDYATWRQANEASIVKFIAERCSLQVPLSERTIEYLLVHGYFVVVFDGLDELLETSGRRDVRDDVESFSRLYPGAPVLVTSRQVGYEQAPLNSDVFDLFVVLDFDDQQIDDYVKKWFGIDDDLHPRQQQEMSAAFMRDSLVVPDLRKNPLMLALMCNLYRGERYIPRNRPDVYEKCSNLLFEKWDKSRGIEARLPFDAHVSPTIKYLAYWIYNSPALQEGVTEHQLVAQAASYLSAQLFEVKEEAETAARQFVEFCRGRAWVFSDTGSTGEGESLYQFTHRTFLEYFAAFHLVRTNPAPSELTAVLLPKIRTREWDVVAQLACQIQSKTAEAAADTLLDALISSAVVPDVEKLNALDFAARAMSFLVPTPGIARRVVKAVVDYACFTPALRIRQTRHPSARDGEVQPAENMLRSIVNARLDNHRVIAKAICEELLPKIVGDDAPLSGIAAEIGVRARYLAVSSTTGSEIRQELDALISTPAIIGRRRAHAERHVGAGIDAVRDGIVDVEEFMSWHGVDGLFRRPDYRVIGRDGAVTLASWLVWTAGQHARATKEFGGDIDVSLGKVGRRLGQESPPWSSSSPGGHHYLVPMSAENDDVAAMTPDAAFGLLALYCASSEPESISRFFWADEMPRPSIFRDLVDSRARAEPAARDRIRTELERFRLSDKQREAIEKWASGRVSFWFGLPRTTKRDV